MGEGKKGSEEPLQVLRAKYHDYCSAQVADLLVLMSPDEIYLLAHRAYREEGGEGDISYVEMMRVATDWLGRRIALQLAPASNRTSTLTSNHAAQAARGWAYW